MALGPLHYIRYLLLLLISWVTQGYSQNLSFQPGTSYGYYYTLDLELKHISQPSMPGTKLNIKANIQTYLLWKNKVQTDDQLVLVQIQDFAIQRSKCNNTKDSYVIEEFGDIVNGSSFGRPVLFHWKSGKILALYGAGEDNSQILDLKRGLVSLFQFQPLTGNQTEDDISGRCLVTYQTSENLITKTKDLSSCRNLPFGFQDGNMFGVFLNSSSKSKLAHDGGVIQMAVTEESHIVSLYVKSLLGSQITSRQQLQLISSIPGSAEIPGDSVHSIVDGLPEKYHKIEIASHPQRRSQGNQLLSQYLKTSKTKSSKLDISKISTNKDFIAFVRMFRQAKKKDVLQLLKTASKELV
ncbi:hypothetical protein GDO86_013135 [Hymenochirus boettgeri]|uniref:Vitellogenin domain-containing protein n=1 Tax=Hymenochirus boettgeri TaxID=247094 RepID=A0A8T2IVH5_9PIPI|nr:hypothetical protein GDO86_013135 [Hymenochirus boettgeri]KAG8435051.1 hypothetical protein GDO86_013135 [Hymenochirus boettgeri]